MCAFGSGRREAGHRGTGEGGERGLALSRAVVDQHGLQPTLELSALIVEELVQAIEKALAAPLLGKR